MQRLSDDDIFYALNTALRERIQYRKENRQLKEALEQVKAEKATLTKEKEEVENRAADFERRYQVMSQKYTEQKAETEKVQADFRRRLRIRLGESGLLSKLQELEHQHGLLSENDGGGSTQVSIRTVRSALEKWLRGFGGEFTDTLRPVIPDVAEVVITQGTPYIQWQQGAPWTEGVTRVRCRVVATGWKVNDEIIEKAILDVIEPIVDTPQPLPEPAPEPQGAARQPESSPPVEAATDIELPGLHDQLPEPADEATIASDLPGYSQSNYDTAEPVHPLASDSNPTNAAEVRESGESHARTKKRIPSQQEIEAMIGRATDLYEQKPKRIKIGEFVGAKALLSTLYNGAATLESAVRETGIHEPKPEKVLIIVKKLISDPNRSPKYLKIVGEDKGIREFMSEFWKAVTDKPDMNIPDWIKNNT
jgi:hypothetical protein